MSTDKVRESPSLLGEAERPLLEQHLELLHAARLGDLGQMAALLAHEMTQPLSAITNYLSAGQRLLNAGDPASRERLGEALRRAGEQTARAAEIVSRLRAFASAEPGGMKPEPIARIVEEAALLAAQDAAQRGVQVSLDPGPDAVLVLADRAQVQQVLLNLVRNALDAMEGQERRELQLSVAATADGVEVSVADTGPGLAPEAGERLFRPFVTTKASGMGIGLSICRRIVDAHGGRLWVEDNPGGGAVFKFALQPVV